MARTDRRRDLKQPEELGSLPAQSHSPQRSAGQSYPTPDARDSRFASNPFVVQNGRDYAMFYYGFRYQRPGRACEMLALGVNPYSFVKSPEILIDTGAPGTIDETFAHKPSVITHEGVLYHFYCAVSGQYPNEVRGIAVARSKPW